MPINGVLSRFHLWVKVGEGRRGGQGEDMVTISAVFAIPGIGRG